MRPAASWFEKTGALRGSDQAWLKASLVNYQRRTAAKAFANQLNGPLPKAGLRGAPVREPGAVPAGRKAHYRVQDT